MDRISKKEPLEPVVAVGVVLLAAGALAWLWFGDWRWAVTGVVALLVTAILAASLRHGQ